MAHEPESPTEPAANADAQARSDGALRAALTPAFTPRRFRHYLDRGGDPARLGCCSPSVLASILEIGRREAIALARALRRADPEGERARARRASASIAVWGDAHYPPALAQLADPPPALYARGGLLDCDSRAIALIGSRRASDYGLRVARQLASDLARAGVTVISGLARGIDAAAHQAVLRAGARTVAVLGSGLLRPYPPEHVDLLEAVSDSGAVLSEFPLEAPPARVHFPRRNRLLAALAVGVVVVEAAERSGALGTVGHALEQGRTVMAVPGPVDSPTSRGTLRMLKEGAPPVGSVTDIFEALGWCRLGPRELPPAEQSVLDALRDLADGGSRGGSARDVAMRTDMPEEVAAGHLVTLEVRGLIERTQGGRYELT